MREITCAFTGHSPHKFPWKDNEADPRCVELKETLAEQIAMLVKAGVWKVSGGFKKGNDIMEDDLPVSKL